MGTTIGFTGTHLGMTIWQKKSVRDMLGFLSAAELHHGDCIGADAEAHEICQDLDIPRVVHPPENPRARAMCGLNELGTPVLPKKPYLERNHDIVDACNVLIAAPKSAREEQRSGTWATVRYARKQGKTVYIIWLDGKVEVEDKL